MHTIKSNSLTVNVLNCKNNTYGLEFIYDNNSIPYVFINISDNEQHIRVLCDYLCKNCVSEYHIEEIIQDYKSNPNEFISFIS